MERLNSFPLIIKSEKKNHKEMVPTIKKNEREQVNRIRGEIQRYTNNENGQRHIFQTRLMERM